MRVCSPPVIRLRPLHESDVPVFASWGKDPRFVEHAGWSPGLPDAELRAFWTGLVNTPPPELLRLAAERDQVLIGYVDLHGTDPVERELGYAIGPSSCWGKGLGTAVAGAALNYAFDVLGLESVWAEALPANATSLRILQRIGMRSTGSGEPEEFLGVIGRYEQFRITRREHARLTDRAGPPAPPADQPGTARRT